jgi:hypothetical protein
VAALAALALPALHATHRGVFGLHRTPRANGNAAANANANAAAPRNLWLTSRGPQPAATAGGFAPHPAQPPKTFALVERFGGPDAASGLEVSTVAPLSDARFARHLAALVAADDRRLGK